MRVIVSILTEDVGVLNPFELGEPAYEEEAHERAVVFRSLWRRFASFKLLFSLGLLFIAFFSNF